MDAFVHGFQPATNVKLQNRNSTHGADKSRRFSSNRPIDPVCETILSKLEQGWSYRSVLSEFTLRVEALWAAVSWGVGQLRQENRALRAEVRMLRAADDRGRVVEFKRAA